MASYSSYKTVKGDQIPDGVISNDKLEIDARRCFCTKWIYGSPGACTTGCCCRWVVPADTRTVRWELWGAGGNGHGACSCSRCQHFAGAGGGSYNTKSIISSPNCAYTVCAGGVFPCYSRECNGCQGCTSYVNGYNLSNFCALGGARGCANGSWTDNCFSRNDYCVAPGTCNGEFAAKSHTGPFGAAGSYMYPGDACHCWKHLSYSSSAFGLNTAKNDQFINNCWIRCGCWTVPYASGGQGGKSSICGSSCCGQGGTGGSGLVKITYF